MSDKEAGIIIAKGQMSYVKYPFLMYQTYHGHISYTLKLYLKDDRYRAVLTSLIHSNEGQTSITELGKITTDEVYSSQKSMYTKYQNLVWDDIKVVMEAYSNDLFNSLEEKTSKKELDSDWGDW
jgi:hypothetical protein